MGRMADRIAAALTAEVAARTEWDEPPALFFLYLRGGVPLLRQVPLPAAVWARERPPVVLRWMSQAFGEFAGLMQSAAPEGLHGAAFYSETWAVESGAPGTAERSEAVADSHAHRLHLRPDRVEARGMWAVDRAGITYGAIMRRGIDAEPRTQVSYPGPSRKRITGNVPESLERIVAAMLAVTMPGGGG